MKSQEGKIFLILYDNLTYLEEKLKDYSQNFSFYNLPSKVSKEALIFSFNEILKKSNQKLFGLKEDLVIKGLENLPSELYPELLELLKVLSSKVFLALKEEKKFEELKSFLTKKINFEVLDWRIKGHFQVKRIVSEELKKLNIKASPELINVLAENYQTDISSFFQDLKKLELYLYEGKINPGDFKNFFQALSSEFKIQESFLELNFPLFVNRFKKYLLSLSSLPYSEREFKIKNLLNNLLVGALIKIYLLKSKKENLVEGHPFYLNKLKNYSQKLDFQTIKLLLKTLALIDRKLNKYYLNYRDLAEEIVSTYLLLQKSY